MLPSSSDNISSSDNSSDEYVPEDTLNPQFLSKSDLNDLVRDLKLTKQQSENLASRLKEFNLLQKNVSASYYRKRSDEFGLAGRFMLLF